MLYPLTAPLNIGLKWSQRDMNIHQNKPPRTASSCRKAGIQVDVWLGLPFPGPVRSMGRALGCPATNESTHKLPRNGEGGARADANQVQWSRSLGTGERRQKNIVLLS
jgi:hypothetical protein